MNVLMRLSACLTPKVLHDRPTPRGNVSLCTEGRGFGGFLGRGTEIFSLKCNTVGAVFPPPSEFFIKIGDHEVDKLCTKVVDNAELPKKHYVAKRN